MKTIGFDARFHREMVRKVLHAKGEDGKLLVFARGRKHTQQGDDDQPTTDADLKSECKEMSQNI